MILSIVTTLTINIPDSSLDIKSDITSLVNNAGGTISVYSDDDNLSAKQMELLKEGYKEALLIKDGKLKGIPCSQMWDEQ